MAEARKSDLVDITCTIVAERDKAIAITDGTVEFKNGHERHVWFWLPRSQIEIEPQGQHFVVTMPMWLARNKGLI